MNLTCSPTIKLCRPECSGTQFAWQVLKQFPLVQLSTETRFIQSPPENRLATSLEFTQRECIGQKAERQFKALNLCPGRFGCRSDQVGVIKGEFGIRHGFIDGAPTECFESLASFWVDGLDGNQRPVRDAQRPRCP